MTMEQWGFFSVLHLLWHETFVYNVHYLGPVTLTPVAERLAVELSLPVLTTYRLRSVWDSNTQASACEVNAWTCCATAAVLFPVDILENYKIIYSIFYFIVEMFELYLTEWIPEHMKRDGFCGYKPKTRLLL